MASQNAASDESGRCVLTVKLTFRDRIDADDAVNTMESCITDALAMESSIEEL